MQVAMSDSTLRARQSYGMNLDARGNYVLGKPTHCYGCGFSTDGASPTKRCAWGARCNVGRERGPWFWRGISVRQPFAGFIARGEKPEEYRTWTVNYRGPIVIVASGAKIDDGAEDWRAGKRRARWEASPEEWPTGKALCVATLSEIREHADYGYAWRLSNVVQIAPFSVTGKTSLYFLTVGA